MRGSQLDGLWSAIWGVGCVRVLNGRFALEDEVRVFPVKEELTPSE